MQLSGTLSFISLLAALPLGHTASPSCSKLERRHHHEPHAPFSNIYIMQRKLHYENGTVPIYLSDGTVAYKFAKNVQDPIGGTSSASLFTNSTQTEIILQLTSNTDSCYRSSTYAESAPVKESLRIDIDTRGVKSDRWNLSFTDPTGHAHYYRFDRNTQNEQGKIYAVDGKKKTLVGELRIEKRGDTWLTKGHKRAKTFTLFCTSDAPQMEFVVWMGLILQRVQACQL